MNNNTSENKNLCTTGAPIETPWGYGIPTENVVDHCTNTGATTADPCYVKMGDYLNDHSIKVIHLSAFDYKEAPFAAASDELAYLSQCRADGLDSGVVEDYKIRFDGGEKIDYPPIAVEINGKYCIKLTCF